MAVDPESRSSSLIVIIGVLSMVLLGGALAFMALNRPQATPRGMPVSAPAPDDHDARP